jgi:hypothetical protein
LRGDVLREGRLYATDALAAALRFVAKRPATYSRSHLHQK